MLAAWRRRCKTPGSSWCTGSAAAAKLRASRCCSGSRPDAAFECPAGLPLRAASRIAAGMPVASVSAVLCHQLLAGAVSTAPWHTEHAAAAPCMASTAARAASAPPPSLPPPRLTKMPPSLSSIQCLGAFCRKQSRVAARQARAAAHHTAPRQAQCRPANTPPPTPGRTSPKPHTP